MQTSGPSRKTLAGAGVLAAATALATAATALPAMAAGPGGPAAFASPAAFAQPSDPPSAPPSAPPTGSAQGSAYGLALMGPVSLPPVPAVSSGGREVRKDLARANEPRLLTAAVTDVGAASRRADSTVTKLRVPVARLSADVLSARCDAGRGSARLVNVDVAGKRLLSAPPPNTTIPIEIPGAGKASLTLNRQRRLPDGRLSVTALEATLPLGALGSQTLKAASATCGQPVKRPVAPSIPAPAPAPAPTPIEGDLAVTG
ncbi:choice-of-anchor P family protein [Actinomadura viridis]|uniref:choice-of-anchor P family protein n=1 Tax=Actinomadura viridis TaxID=58110 RepID=UPI0036B32910